MVGHDGHVSATSTPLPSGAAAWVAGARPRTLPISVAPVLVGVACAAAAGDVRWWRAVAALIVSLLLQVGVNFANDYSDGVRGTDADRVGPMRLTASGAVPARQVLAGAWLCFGLAALVGLAVAATTSWWLLVTGAGAIAAAWFYTGGTRPYGYRGYGDLSVFVFFGLVAVIGTAYVARDDPRVTGLSIACAVPCGLLAVGVLVVNNLRDIPRDAAAGKRTLAVMLGDRLTRRVFAATLLLPYAVLIGIALAHPWTLLATASASLAVGPVRTVLGGAVGPKLMSPLAVTGRLMLIFAALLSVGLVV